MSENVFPLGNITRLDLPTDRVLEAAKGDCTDGVVVLGFDNGGDLYIADILQAGEAGPSDHRHLREVVARRLISEIMPSDIRIQADEVVATLFRMAADVDRRTDDLEMDEELYGEADTLAKAYSNAVYERRRERDSEDDDRPAHPDRAASGVQLP